MVLAFVFALVLVFVGSVLSLYPGLIVRNALVNRRTNMNLATKLALTSFPSRRENGKWETYNTTCRPKSLRLTPKLISIPLDIIHAVQNHKAVFAQHALCPGIRDPARLLLRARRIVHCPRVVDIIVRRDDVDLVFGLWGRVGGEELSLGFF